MDQIKLYSYWRSSCSYRVRIALELKKLPYEIIPVHLVKDGGEQFKENYKNLNSRAELPTIVHGDFILTQSDAIIDYLEQIDSKVPLFFKDLKNNSVLKSLIQDINSGIQPIQNLSVLKKLSHKFGDNFDKRQWCHWVIHKGFVALEKKISNYNTKWAISNLPSALDCFIVPQIYNALRFKVDMEEFPNLLRVWNLALGHPSFIKAHPDNQPDAQTS